MIALASSVYPPKFLHRILLLRPASSSGNKVRQFVASSTNKKKHAAGSLQIVRAGVPLILFCGLGVWVVSSGIEGKNKERDAFQGRMSRSERQVYLEKEHDDMMNRLNYAMEQDFDNTKRIERPEDILARRRKERETRNVWYRRWLRQWQGQDSR